MRGYRTIRSNKRNSHSISGQKKREIEDIRNSKNFGFGFALLTGLTVFLVLVLGFALFFKIGSIEVYGNRQYTTEKVIEASGINRGDNLYLFNKFGTIQRMFSSLPYLKEVRIRRELPDVIRIDVEEREARLAIFTEQDTWIMSVDGKLLEKAEEGRNLEDYSWIYGLKMEKAKVGDDLSSVEERGVKVLLELLRVMEREKLTDRLGDVDLTEDYNVQFTYEDRFLVSTGMPENIEKKVIYLQEVVKKLSVTDKGTISLGGEQLRFVPSDTVPVLQVENSPIEQREDPETDHPFQDTSEPEQGSSTDTAEPSNE